MDPKAHSWPKAAGFGGASADRSGFGRAVTTLVAGDPGYPAQLGALASGEAATLWLRGDGAALCTRPAVTVVGSRAASREGEALAHALAAALAAQGVLVVSGGALGIDAAAHRGALAAGGRTCAVLGCGVDIAYPQRHERMFTDMTERGCLVSMFEPGSPPLRWHFPARNELMAALADLVVLIEARADSGSLITATHARRHRRPVAAFAGSPGADAVIAAGAQRVDSIAQVVALVEKYSCEALAPYAARVPACAPPTPSFLGEQSAEVAKVLAALSAPLAPAVSSPIDLGELCAIAGLSPGDCAAALVDLELRGRCTRLAGGRYIVHAPLS
jgi:DNA processing protein